ncbi:MAG TPA: NAD-binding protein [Smithellaceae bacterium]|nr:NAD-binding protein [Smithellaceae bacterium]
MNISSSQKFAIIGAGIVGTALGFLLRRVGHEITAIADKSAAHLKRALAYTGGESFLLPQKAIKKADCILITTSDDAIAGVCRKIAAGNNLTEKIVFHVSGAGSLDLLEPARQAGAHIASIHPIQSFSSIDNAIQNIPGSVFGITADKKIKKWAKDMKLG